MPGRPVFRAALVAVAAPSLPPPAAGASRRLVRNFSALAVAGAASKALTLASSLVVARVLGPVGAGELLSAQSLISVALVFTDLGITVLTVRDIVTGFDGLSELVSATTVVQAAAAVVLTGVVAVVAAVAPLPPHAGRLLVLASPILVMLAFNLAFALQALEDMVRVAIARLLAVAVTGAGSIVAVVATRRAAWVAVMGWIGCLAADAVIVVWLRRRHAFRLVRTTPGRCWSLFARSLPFLQSGLLYVAVLSVDTISLALLGTAHDVGVYGVAWTVSFSAGTLALLVADAAFPEMVRRFERSSDALRDMAEQVLVLVARVSLAGAALVVVEAGAVVHLLVGPAYGGAGPLLRVLFWLAPVAGLATIGGYVLVAGGRQRALVRVRLATAAVAVVGCPLAAAAGGPRVVAAVILAANCTELAMITAVSRRYGLAPSARVMLRQLEYLAVPAVPVAAVAVADRHASLVVAVGAWAAGVAAVEWRRGWPTLGLLDALRPARAR